MNALNQFFSSSAIQPLGWTLLHSLWQGALIALVVFILLRLLMLKSSAVKYMVTLGGLTLQLIVSVVTFVYLYEPVTFQAATPPKTEVPNVIVIDTPLASADVLDSWIIALQNYLPMIVLIWLSGAFIFSLRVVASGFYITQLRKHTTPVVSDEVLDMMDCWLLRLGISRKVQLAESVCVDTPLVIGYLKPLILFPAGMISGLPTEQLELIVLHELTHIRRHDYIINILQLLMEAVFFFNPFVWMLSSRIREEREHCCDDAVVQHSGKASLYAITLAQLEEARLQRTPVALALGGAKNQLLTRIKRLMDKRVRPYTGRERVIPALLMVVGLVCASWLTISTRNQDAHKGGDDLALVQQDTTKNQKTKRASYTKKKVTTYATDGTPHEEVTENFEGDENLRDLVDETDEDFDFSMPIPPPMPGMEIEPPMPDFVFHYDTVPPMIWSWDNNAELEKFNAEFQKKFQEEFSEFYQKHQEEIQKMMVEVQKEIQNNVPDEKWQKDFEARMKVHEEAIQKQIESMNLDERALAHQAEAMKHVEQQLKHLEEIQLQRSLEMEKHSIEMEKHSKEMEKQAQKMEKHAKVMEEKAKQFEEEVKEQLVKDGYLKKGEKIENLNWRDNGKIIINGKEVKESDRKKYDAIHNKYFNSKGDFIIEK